MVLITSKALKIGLKMHLEKFKIKTAQSQLKYGVKQMEEHGYWKWKQGISNSGIIESFWFCFKGKKPSNIPQKPWYVDVGSPLFIELMKNVPVLAPK